MPFHDEADDEPSTPGVPLPPEDRLWRHPSELGAFGSGPAGRGTDPLDTPWPPLAALTAPPSSSHRRGTIAVAIAASCLAGAVVALGVSLSRPTKVVERNVVQRTATQAVTTAASFAPSPVPAAALARTLGPSVARVDAKVSGRWTSGAGALVDAAGSVVTTSSLVFGATEVVVTFDDGVARRGRLLGVDAATGVAVVDVEPGRNRPASLSTTRPAVGTPVALVGAPTLTSGTGTATVSSGFVRAVGREHTTDAATLHDLIEVDRDIPADSQGGLLADEDGRVVGVAMGDGDLDGVGDVVPAVVARDVVRSLVKAGSVPRAWLGVKATDLDAGQAVRMGSRRGAAITEVTDGSPAARAGIRPGDVLVRVGDQPIASTTDVMTALRTLAPGERAAVALVRDDQKVTVVVTLGDR